MSNNYSLFISEATSFSLFHLPEILDKFPRFSPTHCLNLSLGI